MIARTSLDLPRKCSAIFGKWSVSSENRQKRRHQYVYIIKRTLHGGEKILILCPRGKNSLTRPLRSLVRYCSCHWKIKFISSRHRAISSVSYFPQYINFHRMYPLIENFRLNTMSLSLDVSLFQNITNDPLTLCDLKLLTV